MKVLVVNHQEVQQWLSMSECVEVMADVFKMLKHEEGFNLIYSGEIDFRVLSWKLFTL